jgi:hypothetical protein
MDVGYAGKAQSKLSLFNGLIEIFLGYFNEGAAAQPGGQASSSTMSFPPTGTSAGTLRRRHPWRARDGQGTQVQLVLVDLADDYADEDGVDQVRAQAHAVIVPRSTYEASARGWESGLTPISTRGLTSQAGALWCIGATYARYHLLPYSG